MQPFDLLPSVNGQTGGERSGESEKVLLSESHCLLLLEIPLQTKRQKKKKAVLLPSSNPQHSFSTF